MSSRSRWAVATLWALLLTASIVGAATAWQRSLYPRELGGRVDSVQVRPEDQLGVDDYVLIAIGGSTFQADSMAEECFEEGSRVDKRPWSGTVIVDGRSCVLPAPRQAWADTLTPILFIIAMLRVRRVATTRARQR